jgi:hypothetical protein
MADSQQLIMDYGRVSTAGQAAGDAATNLATTVDQTAPGCVGAARAYPAWATSQAVLDLHTAHTENLNGHISDIRSISAGIQGSVEITAAADRTSAADAEGIAINSGL